MLVDAFYISNTAVGVAIVIGGVWLCLAAVVASYGNSRGIAFFPLFVCSLLPFPGWPLTLLAVTVAPRQAPRR